jgi:hypothetical protein
MSHQHATALSDELRRLQEQRSSVAMTINGTTLTMYAPNWSAGPHTISRVVSRTINWLLRLRPSLRQEVTSCNCQPSYSRIGVNLTPGSQLDDASERHFIAT